MSETARQALVAGRARIALIDRIRTHIGSSDFSIASTEIQQLIEQAGTPSDRVQGHVLLSELHRAQGDAADADAALLTAIGVVDQTRLTGGYIWSGYRASLLVARAQNAAFPGRDLARAVALYDEAAREPEAKRRTVRVAAQNAAMYAAQLGRYAEAARRIDEILASPLAEDIPPDDLLPLQASQLSMLVSAGNLSEAFRRSQSLWEQHRDSNDFAIFDIGINLAHWYPVPTECERRMAIAQTLLAKLTALRARPVTGEMAPSPHDLDRYEYNVLVILADSRGCAPDSLVTMARGRLGLGP